MPRRFTPGAAVMLAAVLAVAVYVPSLRNGWAGDDPLVIERNARAHSVPAALGAWFEPYWPPPWERAGLYRPFTILTYGAEWSVSGGAPWLFHLDNVLLHAVATALAVAIALLWLPPLGAFAAGALFGVHPVHVEAVANVVGRAELLSAVAVLGAILAARRFRHAEQGRAARWWLAACVTLVLAGLFSKENAVIAVAAIALEHGLDRRSPRRSSWGLYVPVAAVTLGWLFLWQAIVGDYVATGATSAFYGMSRGEQWATMMPVQLDVLRLLSWPMLLASDYSPQTVPVRLTWGPLAALGLVTAGALLLLGLLTVRRAPAVAFGILLAAGSYAPTSNLLFTSGVVLAERALYLSVLAPALVLGWVMARADARAWRRLAWSAAGLYCMVLAGRAMSRTPYWRDAQDMIIEDVVDNPQNYRAHIHLGDMFATRRDSARALAHYLTAAALAEHDPFTFQFIVGSAVAVGRPQLAVAEGRRVHDIAPQDPRTGGWLAEAYVAAGLPDSAVAVTERNLRQHPGGPAFVANYLWSLRRAGAPPARILAIQALDDWLAGRLVQAGARLDSLATMANQIDAGFCETFVLARDAITVLKPEFLVTVGTKLGQECPVMSKVQMSDGHAN